MSRTHFSGAVVSAGGFIDGSGNNVVTGADLVAVTATGAEIDAVAGVTPGTALASKALVLNASKGISTITSATITSVTSTTATVTDFLRGATPVHQVDPGSCTITAAAGAANTSTVTVTLKDGAGVALTRSIPFQVYASSAADGLTLAAAASTGFSVASGGLSLANGAVVTTSIRAMSSASGACVLSLLDTAKTTSYLVLVLDSGIKISAQLSAGSYG